MTRRRVCFCNILAQQMMPKRRAVIDRVKSRSDSANKIGIDIDDKRTRRRGSDASGRNSACPQISG
jgi:hypothetical protein